MSKPSSSKLSLLAAAVLMVAGVIIAAVSGMTKGSVPGGVVAALGVVPALHGAWKGMRQETQAGLASSLLMAFASLGVGAVLIVLAAVDWIR